MDFLQNHVEALIFCSPNPIKHKDLKNALSEMFDTDVPDKDIENALSTLKDKYKGDDYAIEIVKSGGGYQFLTKPAYQASIGVLLKQQSKRRLSTSSLETLSIIAYKQPVTKSEVEQIRGVNCDYTIHKLLEKELIEIRGKTDGIGRPLIYGTSDKFMDYFGINAMDDLPTPKDFATEENRIGDERAIDISPDKGDSKENN